MTDSDCDVVSGDAEDPFERVYELSWSRPGLSVSTDRAAEIVGLYGLTAEQFESIPVLDRSEFLPTA